MLNRTLLQKENNFRHYFIGEKEYRPWGYFSVSDVSHEPNKEFCEKEIVLMPHKAMSVQRHHYRSEIWTVISGTLTAILDGNLYTLNVGDSINIGLGAVHCMINRTNEKTIIHERQIGMCREEDNDRFCDINGRDTMVIDPSDLNALESVALYKRTIKNL